MIAHHVLGAVALGALIPTISLILIRLARGPSIYDRILAANVLTSKILLVLVALGFFLQRPEFIDVPILYALIGFLTSLAVLRFAHANSQRRSSDNPPKPPKPPKTP